MIDRLSPQWDRAFGRYIGKRGTRRVLEEAEIAPSNYERMARWRVHYAAVPIEHTLSPHRKPSC